MRRAAIAAVAFGAVVLAACSGADVDANPSAQPTASPVGGAALAAPAGIRVATVGASAGNTTAGSVDLRTPPTSVELGVEPAWLVAAPLADGATLWVCVGTDGTVAAVAVAGDGTVTPVAIGDEADPRHPPALHAPDGLWELVTPPVGTAPDAGILPLGDGRVVTILDGGDLSITRNDSTPLRVPGPFLPDARPIRFDERSVVVLYGPTDEYGHGVIGDDLEATEARVVDVDAGSLVGSMVPEGRVIEGVLALVGDLGGASGEEIVVTTSGPADGARIEAWNVTSGGRWVGEAIGAAGRWRHEIAVAPTVAGASEIVEVVTPHLDRVATFWQIDGPLLVRTAEQTGAVVSHMRGSRSMQNAAVVDLDADGLRDLVGPGLDGGLAVAFRSGAQVQLGHVDAPDPASNLAVTTTVAGEAALGYVTADGTLVLWVGA